MIDRRVSQLDDGDQPLRVTVAIVTYRRPGQLSKVMATVLDQADRIDLPVDLLVVDNDPEGSARKPAMSTNDHRVRYVQEPRPGLSAARNAALDSATASRVLVFVDDDDEPQPRWLSALIAGWQRWECDLVAGNVVREIEPNAASWVLASGFFQSGSRRSGERLLSAGSGNLLLDLDTIRRLNVRFDDRFGLTGGEDTMFTRSASAQGAVIRWCADAVVVDRVPSQRQTRAWVLRREFRAGSTWSRTHIAVEETFGHRVRRSAQLIGLGIGLAGRGAGQSVCGCLLRRLSVRARGERDVARGLGLLVGVLNLQVEEYARPSIDPPVPSNH